MCDQLTCRIACSHDMKQEEIALCAEPFCMNKIWLIECLDAVQ